MLIPATDLNPLRGLGVLLLGISLQNSKTRQNHMSMLEKLFDYMSLISKEPLRSVIMNIDAYNLRCNMMHRTWKNLVLQNQKFLSYQARIEIIASFNIPFIRSRCNRIYSGILFKFRCICKKNHIISISYYTLRFRYSNLFHRRRP